MANAAAPAPVPPPPAPPVGGSSGAGSGSSGASKAPKTQSAAAVQAGSKTAAAAAPAAAQAAAATTTVTGGAVNAAGGSGRFKLEGNITLDDFELGVTLGTGSFGRVRFATHKVRDHHKQKRRTSNQQSGCFERENENRLTRDGNGLAYVCACVRALIAWRGAQSTNTIWAIKMLKKAEVIRLQQVEHMISEKSILQTLDHPFIVSLGAIFQGAVNEPLSCRVCGERPNLIAVFAFRSCCVVACRRDTADVKYLYMVLEYIVGGEFFTHLRKAGQFDATASRFYAAQITTVFEYMHALDFIYRDLKPENLLLDQQGYLKITGTWRFCFPACYSREHPHSPTTS